MKRFAALLVALTCAFSSHARSASAPTPARETDLSWFFAALREADAVEVLEGLPHPLFEDVDFAFEKKRRATFTIGKEVFYEQRLNVPEELTAELTRGFAEQKLFKAPLQGAPRRMKFCGGFHADYGIAWLKNGERLAAALVCFGCGDIQLVGPTSDVMCDMTAVGREFLQPRLRPLRTLRPPYQHLQKQMQEAKRDVLHPEKPQIDLKR